jgi:hypothetical protein
MTDQYLTTKQLCDRLNISRSTLYRMRVAQTLAAGTHFLDIRPAGAKRACIRWKVQSVERTLATPARNRAK